MRISSSQVFDAGTRSILNGQSNLYKIQNQLSTGRKFLSAQDDPVAAAQVLLDSQAQTIIEQHISAQSNASSQLAFEEDRLQAAVESLQYIREQVIAGNKATLTDQQRGYIADTIESQFSFLVGVANGRDADGTYLFSGYKGDTEPFQVQANGSVIYRGDDGQRLLQVDSSRQIAVSDAGSDIFQRISTGNGTFSLSASAANTGTGTLASGSIANQSALVAGFDYQIRFTSATTYDIYRQPAGSSPAAWASFDTGNTYVAGSEITDIPGISMSITGQPQTSDQFNVMASTNQGLFQTFKNLAAAFRMSTDNSPTAKATASNQIYTEFSNLDQALTHVVSVQASIGSRMNELDSMKSMSESLDLDYSEKISNLQELDYAAAISAFMQQNMQLEAAQSSFSKISGLSLFNYIG